MHSTKLPRLSLIVVVGLLLSGILACDFGGGAGAAKPRVTLESPVSGLDLEVGQEVEIACLLEDPKGVASVELAVDGVLYATEYNPDPEGEPQWKFVGTWVAKVEPGPHTLTITAYNLDEVASDPVSVSVTVVQGAAPGATGAVTSPTHTPAAPGTTATVPSVGPTETAAAPAATRTTAASPRPTNTSLPASTPTNTPVPAPPTNTPVPPPTSTPVPALPDLIVYAVWLDRETVEYGGTVHVHTVVVNQGNAPARAFAVAWDTGPSGNGVQRVPCCLGPNVSYTVEWDSWPLYASYDTRAIADCDWEVQESNEDNNTLDHRINVLPQPPSLPDLVVTSIELSPQPVAPGGTVQAQIVVRNQGTAASGPFAVRWEYGSLESDVCADIVMGLDQDRAATVQCTTHSLVESVNTVAIADPAGQIQELDEDNNRLERWVNVG